MKTIWICKNLQKKNKKILCSVLYYAISPSRLSALKFISVAQIPLKILLLTPHIQAI